MRKIKFRAWDKKKKEMLFGIPLTFGTILQGGGKRENCFQIGSNEDESFTAMQYTGLKDKNGKEIYEGDACNGKRIYEDEPYLFEVKYDDKWAGFLPFANDRDGNYYENTNNIASDCEIIGNVYESPELLK